MELTIEQQIPRLLLAQDCDLTLNFSPEENWPKFLPGISLNKVALGGFQQPAFTNYEAADPSVYETAFLCLLKDTHRELSFVEIANLVHAFRRKNSNFPEAKIYELYFGPYSDSIRSIVDFIPSLPGDLLLWSQQKKLFASDFEALKALHDQDLVSYEKKELRDLFQR